MIERMFEYVTDGYHPIPAGLDGMAPGPELGAVLASIDVNAVSGYDRVVVLKAQQRMVSHHQAQAYAAMAAITAALDDVENEPQWPAESLAAAEIRAALRWTRRAVEFELVCALGLERRLPRVWDLLAAGVIDTRRAKTILDGTAHLSDQVAQKLVDTIVDRAGQLTTGQLAAFIRRLSIQVDPDDAHHRYETAVTRRRVVTEVTEDGTANLLGLDLAPHRVAAATRRINRIARSLHTSGETRTMDQLRADVFLDLLNGKTVTGTGSDQAVVDLTVDLETLAGLAESPGDLDGYGPVIADIARQVATQQETSEWRFTVTHPDSGMPIHVGTTQRRPTLSMRRVVEARHPTCVFPGCRMPARACDLDHRIPWSHGGPTSVHHLAPLCRHDHRIRHHGWTYQPLPNGDHHWTSPLNHTSTTSGTPP
jgi:hypothetical protein